MNYTAYERLSMWWAETCHDLRLCAGILGIWFASAVIPMQHPCQPHLRDAVKAMDDE